MNVLRSAIVVGAGSAGSVVTRRLLDAGVEVQLLEAGRSDENPAIHDLGRLGELWLSDDDWGYFTTPQRHAAGRKLHWPRGKVLGGSHSLNASIWVRGPHADYDRWVTEGAEGWSWQEVAPYFERAERWIGAEREGRGTEGLQDVSDEGYERMPIFEGIHDACVEAGIPHNDDYNGDDVEGVSWMQLTTRNGERLSSWRAYVHDRMDDPKLTVHTGVWVTKLLIEEGRAVGVLAEQDGEEREFRADEVILCAGSLDSPRILLHSGIGSAEHLAEVGIPLTHDLPGVGENLHDHLLVPIVFHATRREIAQRQTNQPVAQVHSWTTFRQGSPVPDTQPIFFALPMVPPGTEVPENCFTLQAGMVRPVSRGHLRLASNDPKAPLLMDPHVLEAPEDVASLLASMKQMREIGAQPALAEEWGAVEVLPGAEVESDDELIQYMREQVVTYHHQVGTCKMGPEADPFAVVCPKTLKVHGLEGVRVADASVTPSVPSGNTNAPAIMIGERAADFMLQP